MRNVNEEQIKTARQLDLLTYLQLHEPDELVRVSANEYRMKSHGSLVISKGLWVHNRTGEGGKSALDFLVKVRHMPFVSAVEKLCGICDSYAYYSLPEEKAKPPPKREFVPPKPVKYPEKMVAYLQKRGITPEIISRCMRLGILYESVYNSEPICVFASFDEAKTPRYAAMRGINSDLKREVAGSDKRYGFLFPAGKPQSTDLICCESAIDILSHAVLENRDCHRLALGGTVPTALIAFLERHQEIQAVSLCLDADGAGQTAAKKIQRQLAEDSIFSHIKVTIEPPDCKDYNLMLTQKIEREQRLKIQQNKNILL